MFIRYGEVVGYKDFPKNQIRKAKVERIGEFNRYFILKLANKEIKSPPGMIYRFDELNETEIQSIQKVVSECEKMLDRSTKDDGDIQYILRSLIWACHYELQDNAALPSVNKRLPFGTVDLAVKLVNLFGEDSRHGKNIRALFDDREGYVFSVPLYLFENRDDVLELLNKRNH